MPIEDFHGETFVAFCDISGFKQYMKEPGKAALTLHNFYNGGYNILRNQAAGQTKVDGIFISDCAVMFSRPEGAVIQEKFHRMLHVVEQLNKAMLRHDLMLTTSIAYGHFDYTQRIEFEGIEKNLLMGNPYIEAYLDGSSGKPKLQPGECRLLHHHLPNGFLPLSANDPFHQRIHKRNDQCSYFSWMSDSHDGYSRFQRDYKDAYNQKYRGMLSALQRSTGIQPAN